MMASPSSFRSGNRCYCAFAAFAPRLAVDVRPRAHIAKAADTQRRDRVGIEVPEVDGGFGLMLVGRFGLIELLDNAFITAQSVLPKRSPAWRARYRDPEAGSG